MLVGPMVALIVTMLETGLIASRISLLESAVSRVARQVYIGAASQGTVDKDTLEDYICRRVGPFMADCEGNLNIELTLIDDLDDVPEDDAECRDTQIEAEPTVRFTPGGSSVLVYLRACLTMDIITPGLGIGLNMPKSESGRYQTVAAVAFQNEPF